MNITRHDPTKGDQTRGGRPGGGISWRTPEFESRGFLIGQNTALFVEFASPFMLEEGRRFHLLDLTLDSTEAYGTRLGTH